MKFGDPSGFGKNPYTFPTGFFGIGSIWGFIGAENPTGCTNKPLTSDYDFSNIFFFLLPGLGGIRI